MPAFLLVVHLSTQYLLLKKMPAMIRQSRASKWLGRVENGVHVLETGIKIAQGIKTAYDVGSKVVAAAAPLVAMAP